MAVAGDGQVTMNDSIIKARAKTVRRIYHDEVIVGFAGSAADAQALSDRFESKLEESHGNLRRAVIEFAKDWRTDRLLRRLEALMIVAAESGCWCLGKRGHHRARRQHRRIGVGGGLRSGWARACRRTRSERARDRREGDGHRVGNLRLYEFEHYHREIRPGSHEQGFRSQPGREASAVPRSKSSRRHRI